MDQATIGGRGPARPIVNDIAPPAVTAQAVSEIMVKNPDGTSNTPVGQPVAAATPAVAASSKGSSHPVKATHKSKKINSSWPAVILAVLASAGLAAAAVTTLH
jgi:hypothetical protein